MTATPITFSEICEWTRKQLAALEPDGWWLSYNHCGIYLVKRPGYSLKVGFENTDGSVTATLSKASGRGNGYKKVGTYAGPVHDVAGLVAFARD